MKICQKVHRPGRLLRCPMRCQLSLEGETTCPVCRQVFKSHHRVTVHMGVHRGEKFPCGKCGKVLATRRYWTEHTQSCVQGKWVACPVCQKQFASAQTMHKHHKAQHGTDSVVPSRWVYLPILWQILSSKEDME